MLKIFRFLVMVWLGLLAGALLLVGIVFVLISVVWSLLRGRKPAVVLVSRTSGRRPEVLETVLGTLRNDPLMSLRLTSWMSRHTKFGLR